MIERADPARWFRALGACCKCARPAHGTLFDFRNDSMGAYCTTCANRRLREADKANAKVARKAA
jgi:hypothetical protein